jgi:DNA-directed RNA polymerase specialized sigma24 family protein
LTDRAICSVDLVYAPAVRRFALFLCGDPAMADDITSDTFVRVWLAHRRIRELTVKSYLFATARNTRSAARVKVHRARAKLMEARNPIHENLNVSGERR